MKMLKPSSLIVLEDVTAFSRSMCQVLRNRGIPIVVVQHGIQTNDHAGFFVMPKVGDVQAVWGEYYRRWSIDRGKPDEAEVVTGSPKHDRLRNLTPIDRQRVCRRFGLDTRLKVVLVATEWFTADTSRYTVEGEESYIKHVLKSLGAYDDTQIVVKLHPACQQKYSNIVSQIAEQERVRVVIAKDSLWDLIRLSSFVIVSVSSVCVEALILGRRVISVNLADCRDITGLVQNGLAIGAYSAEEVRQSIGTCMAIAEPDLECSEMREELLSPFTNGNDGSASKRVAELVRTLSDRH